MINEEKVKELFELAKSDANEEKLKKDSRNYYRWDYLWKEAIISFFTGTFAYLIMVLLWGLYNLEDMLERLKSMDFTSIGTTIVMLYIAFIFIYEFITLIVYTYRYKLGRIRLRKYGEHLKKLNQIYNREEKLRR
ncbi:MAG: hypothetical protein UH211_02950 [Agathobacter sp.]|nr:hypothetical protein [Agathobacter sp.]